jgi:PAS domain S-box-containing protein
MAKTSDTRKTKAELVKELQKLRREVARLQKQVQTGGAPTDESLLLRALLDNVPDYIYFKDTGSRFIRTTKAHAQTFGLSDPAEAIGRTDFDFFSDEHAQQAYEDEQRIIRTGEPLLNIEERETWPDRPDTWVLTSKMPLRDQEGNIVGTFGISSDITTRKQAELALERRSAQLQTAAEVSRAASSVLDPDVLIQQVVNLARERFDLYYAGLFLVDEAGKWAVLWAGTGKAGQKMLKQGHKLEIGGESMIGWCVANKQARIALDVGEEAVRFENPFLPETRSELALPLISRGQAIGALTIQSTQEAAFGEEDITVLQTMADQLANAIGNARLYEQIQARAKELAVLNELGQALTAHTSVKEVLDEVYQGASRLLDATNFYVAFYDPDRNEVTFPFEVTGEEEDKFLTLPADQGLTGYIIRNRTPVLIEENLPERLAEMGVELVGKPALSWVGVPMMVGDRVLGVMGTQSYTTSRAYDEHDRDLLTALASHAAIAIQNARLFEEEQQASALLSGRVKELDCLSEIGRRIAESPPIPELLKWVAQRVPPAMQYPDVSVAAVEFGGQVYGSPEAMELPRQMVGGLRIGSERMGQLYIAYTEEHDFLDEESALLGDIVRRLGGYIESRRLFEQTQQRVTELASLNKLGAAIGAEMQVERLAEQVLTQLADLMQVDAAYFALYDEVHDTVEFVRDFIEGKCQTSDQPRRKLGQGRTEYIIRSRQPLLLRGNVQEAYQRLGIKTHDERARGFLGVPMMLADRVLGVLAVQSYEHDDAYGEQHLELLSTVAGQVAVALERTRLFEEMQVALQEVEATHRRYLEQAWDVYLESAETTSYETEHPDAAPLGDAVLPEIQQAVEQRGVTVLTGDGRSALVTPIVVRGATIGALGIHAEDGTRQWTEGEIALVEAVAERMAQVAENLRLLDETQHRAARERLTGEIAARIRETLDMEIILKTAAQEVRRALGLPELVIQLAAPPTSEGGDGAE